MESESTIFANTYCCAHADSRAFADADADACTDADARMYSDACTDAGARTDKCPHLYSDAHADAFLLLFLLTVSSSSLTSMRRFTAPTIWGSEVHFAASHSLLLMWESQLASVHFCTGRGQYRGKVTPVGLLPERNTCLQSTIHFYSFSLLTQAQQRP